jgi:hypothetical protein
MIISRLSGGIGNQMFQYAMGRALSLRRGTALAIDTSSFSVPDRNGVFRQYKLDNFDIAAKIATDAEYRDVGIRFAATTGFLAKAWKIFFKLYETSRPYSRRKMIVEPRFSFVPEILEAPSDCLLIGVWQSAAYFADYRDVIRKELQLKKPLPEKAQRVAESVRGCCSVSIHVRRTDYVLKAATSTKHGTCPPGYYAEAISYMTRRFTDCKFFVFSDDIEWAKETLRIPNSPVFVSSLGMQDFEELSIMSMCKHHIVANSSFSWWGAWLSQNPDKIVIAPKKWFAMESINDEDLVPPEWIRI